jgi:hypothetical protein
MSLGRIGYTEEGSLRSRWDAEDVTISDGDAFVDEVEINLNMFGVLMLDEVAGEVDHIDVVVVDQGGSRQGAKQLQK